MSAINFEVVKMAHQTWRLRLRAYLNGTEDIDPQNIVSHRHCSLGKWIYSTATVDFAHSADFVELEKQHRFMHQLVKQVVDLKRIGRCKEAEQELVKVREFADIVVDLITKIEERVNWKSPEP